MPIHSTEDIAEIFLFPYILGLPFIVLKKCIFLHTFLIVVFTIPHPFIKAHPLSFSSSYIHPVIQRVVHSLGRVKCLPFRKRSGY